MRSRGGGGEATAALVAEGAAAGWGREVGATVAVEATAGMEGRSVRVALRAAKGTLEEGGWASEMRAEGDATEARGATAGAASAGARTEGRSEVGVWWEGSTAPTG